MKIAVTGGIKGRLSGELIRRGFIDLQCDITDENSIKDSISRENPDIIINCAAYTKVDLAEKERLLAYKVNTFGPNFLAKNFNGKIIQISTDYIFDGEKKDELGYREDEIANPLSGYGYSKYMGEVGLRGYMDRVLIVRTTILYEYNKNKTNFVQSVYENLKNNKRVSVPDNLYGNPTFIPHLANQLEYAIRNWKVGIINLAGLNNITRYELALKIADKFNFNKKLIQKGQLVGEAKRGLRTGLIMAKAEQLGYPLYNLDYGLTGFSKQVENG